MTANTYMKNINVLLTPGNEVSGSLLNFLWWLFDQKKKKLFLKICHQVNSTAVIYCNKIQF